LLDRSAVDGTGANAKKAATQHWATLINGLQGGKKERFLITLVFILVVFFIFT